MKPLYRLDWETRMGVGRHHVGEVVELTVNDTRRADGERQRVRGLLVTVAFNHGGGAADLFVVRTSTNPRVDRAYSGAVIESIQTVGEA